MDQKILSTQREPGLDDSNIIVLIRSTRLRYIIRVIRRAILKTCAQPATLRNRGLSKRDNRTMLSFRIVTSVFLPLLFFTSYFGMKLLDNSKIVHTQKLFGPFVALSR